MVLVVVSVKNLRPEDFIDKAWEDVDENYTLTEVSASL